MKRLFPFIGVLLPIVGVAIAAWSCVAVDETEFVVMTEFGRRTAVYGPGDAGLHFERPWRAAIRVDRRLSVFEPAAREVITGDKRNIEAACAVAWRVTDPERYLRSSGSREAVEARLAERVSAALGEAIAKRPLDAIIALKPSGSGLEDLGADVLLAIKDAAAHELGVEIVAIEPTSFVPPLEVRPSVFELIRSERKRVAATLKAEGEAKHREILSSSDREREATLAAADAEAERIRAEGEAESVRILNEAHSRDPRFYEFLRTLESYSALLDDQATLVISSASPILRLLTHGPGPELLKDRGDSLGAPAGAATSLEPRP